MEAPNCPASVGSAAIVGVDAVPVLIEATLLGPTATQRTLGSVDSVIREACPRILSAFGAQGLNAPRGTPLINLLPADLRKSGSGFDLPMALALAGASGLLTQPTLSGVAALGELSLEGRVLPSRGAVAVALAARRRGWSRMLAHPDDARRAAVVPGLAVYPVSDLRAAIEGLAGRDPDWAPLPAGELEDLLLSDEEPLDLSDLRGHETAKTALLVAAAGRHNLLLVGPPGSGKSALLKRISGLLPAPGKQECLEILKIVSVAGGPLPRAVRGRPIRAPHHSSSAASVLGGGADPRPGEVTLAQHGVLFLDELPEFRREILEGLRQPLEDQSVTVGRALRTVTMPADFLLVAAMNPCPCGFANDPDGSCRCPASLRQRYRARVSGPLLDRFDLQVDVPSVPPEAWREAPDPAWSTAALHGAADAARRRQLERNPGGVPNGRLDGRQLELCLGEDPERDAALDRITSTSRLSGRGRVRILRSARTLADLDGAERVRTLDVMRAARLRQLGGD